MVEPKLGPVILFGSGETSHSGGQVFEALAHDLVGPSQVAAPGDLHAAILETPAGFELNSAQVAGRVADFIGRRLQNYQPQIDVIPTRKRHTPHSPDDPALLRPMLHANLIFMGPGSPTYAVRQLEGSRAWQTLVSRHRLGAAIVLASAAAIAAGAQALPVYEIYKAGHDLHWQDGLDFFALYGLSLAFVPHWNNAEGGQDLDTSRCFMGRARFEALLAMLPPDVTVVGIDEHTALELDMEAGGCRVHGLGRVTLIQQTEIQRFDAGDEFDIQALGVFGRPEAMTGILSAVWEEMQAAQSRAGLPPAPPDEVLALVEAREKARQRRDWATADSLRDRITTLGWHVRDTPEGPELDAENTDASK
jgi:cyanophycinase-like exopeptidase